MSGVMIDKFGGIAPRYSPRALPAGAAEVAKNVRLEEGQLRPMNATERLEILDYNKNPDSRPPEAVKSAYRAEIQLKQFEVIASPDYPDTAYFIWKDAVEGLQLFNFYEYALPVTVTATGKLPGGIEEATTYYLRLENNGGSPNWLFTLAEGPDMPPMAITSALVGTMTITLSADSTIIPYWFVDFDAEFSRSPIAHINDPYSRHVVARRDYVDDDVDTYPQLVAFEFGVKNEYRLGIPTPALPPAIIAPPIPDGTGIEELEYVSYITTYTDKFGYEGPPSEATALVQRVRPVGITADEYAIVFDASEGNSGSVSGGIANYVAEDSPEGAQTVVWRLDCTQLNNTAAAALPWYKQPETGDPSYSRGAGTDEAIDTTVTAVGPKAPDEVFTITCSSESGGNNGDGDITVASKTSSANKKGLIHLWCLAVTTGGKASFHAVEMVKDAPGWNAAPVAPYVMYVPKGGSGILDTHPAMTITLAHDGGAKFKKWDSFYITYETDGSGDLIPLATKIRKGAGLFDMTGSFVQSQRAGMRTGKKYGSKSGTKLQVQLLVPTGPVSHPDPGSLSSYTPATRGSSYYIYVQAASVLVSPNAATAVALDIAPGWNDEIDRPNGWALDIVPRFNIVDPNAGTAGIFTGSPSPWRLYTPPGNAPWFMHVTDATTAGGATTKYTVYRPSVIQVPVTVATGVFTRVAHKLETGLSTLKIVADPAGVLPAGLDPNTTYYAIGIDADTFSIALTSAAAFEGTAIIPGDDGTGTFTMTAWAYSIARRKKGTSGYTDAVGCKADGTRYQCGLNGDVHMNVGLRQLSGNPYPIVGDRFYFYLHDKALSFQGKASSVFTVTTEDYDLLDTSVEAVLAQGMVARNAPQIREFTASGDTLTFASPIVAPSRTAVQVASTGTLPAGLVEGTTYYLLTASASVSSSELTSVDGDDAPAIPLADAGTGVHTITVITPQWTANTGQAFRNPYVSFRINPSSEGFEVGNFFTSAVSTLTAIQLSFPSLGLLLEKYKNLVKGFINVYRSNTGGSATAFQYVRRFGINTLSGFDTVASEFLQEVCPSFTWVGPPDDTLDPLTGLPYYNQSLQKVVQFGSNIFVGYTGRVICFSEPGLPHAWPSAYRISLRHDVVDICPIRDGILVLTTGMPILLIGEHPSAMGQIALDARYGCINPRSVIAIEGDAYYATQEGIVRAGSGGVVNITAPYIDEGTWRAKFQPTTFYAFTHEGRYIAQAGVAGQDVFHGLNDASHFIVSLMGDDVMITTTSRYNVFVDNPV